MKSSRALLFTALVICCATTAFAGRPVARWDVVPDQRLDSSFKVGVVAFHIDGCEVEFSVNSTVVHTAQNPTYNDRTDVWEYNFTLDPSSYSDGALTIGATVNPLNATDDSYTLSTITLYANSGGTLGSSVVKYADSVNGSDSNDGSLSTPYATLAKAVTNTPDGGTVYLKAGTYSAASLGGGSSRNYWTTITTAPGVSRSSVTITQGRPSTQRLRFKNVRVVSTSSSGSYTVILTGNGTTTYHYVWLDGIEMCNDNGRYAAETNAFTNGYRAYMTDCDVHDMWNGPGGSLLRGINMYDIASDAWSGGGRLIVNSVVDGIDRGTSSAHPDFHQSYPGSSDWVTNVILYNVSGYDCSCQGLFGLDLKDSAFVNVMFERVPSVDYTSQYNNDMENVIFAHVNIYRQSFRFRGTGDGAFNATDVYMYNNIFNTFSVIEDASIAGVDMQNNHFTGGSPFGSSYTTGSVAYTDESNSDYSLTTSSPAYGTGAYLQCIPADIDGVQYNSSARNKGPFASGTTSSNIAPSANAGSDQSVTDTDDSGSETVTLNGTASSDSDGSIVSYVWTENSAQIATGSQPSVSLAVGTHTITLTVTDDDSATDTDTVVVTVNTYANVAPTANAGSDQSVTDTDDSGSETVTLNGTASSDSDGNIVSYVWTENSTQIATGSQPSVSLAVGTHTITLTVTDDDSATDTDTVVVTVSAPGSGGGDTYEVSGHTNDIELRDDATTQWVGSESFRVGGAAAGKDACAILVFELPTLAAGEAVESASLEVYLNSIGNSPAGNVDLYGIGYRSASTYQTTDYYQGVFGGDTTDAWAIQDDFATLQTTEAAWVATDVSAEGDLGSYIQAQYNAGAVGGDYIFIRLGLDAANVGDYHFWNFASANSTNDPLLTIVTASANEAPTANAGSDQSVTDSDDSGAESVTLDATASSDSDGTIASYVWTENSAQIATGSQPSVSLAVGTHTITLTVTDDDGATDTDTVVASVSAYVNVAPAANAGSDQSVTDTDDSGSETVTLDGTASSDSDGSIVSYVWTENSTQIATGSQPSVSLAVGTHTITLTVTDDDDATDTDTVVVTVSAPASGGNTYPVTGHTNDIELRDDGSTQWVGSESFRVGGATAGKDACAILVFELPTLAAGETVTSASLEVYLNSIGNSPAGNVDLYGIGYRSASTYQTTDYYQGVFGGDTTDAWAIQDNFATLQTTEAAWVATDASAEDDLGSYIQAQYNAGAIGGDYIFIRLGLDATYVGDYHFWNFASANSTNDPLLTIVTGSGNAAPVADAGSDQSVTDTDGSGAESVTLDGTASSDSDGTIASYVWTENSTQIATGSQPSVSLGVGVHTIDLTVTDDDSDTDSDSVELSVYGRTLTSAYDWPANVLPSQSGSFTVEFDLTVNLSNVDAVTGLAYGAADWWDELACIVRLNSSGYIDARDGGSYTADATVAYAADDEFHVEMIVDVASATYSVYITPDGGSRTLLADDFGFRSEQVSITSIDHWTLNDTNDENAHTVSNLIITD